MSILEIFLINASNLYLSTEQLAHINKNSSIIITVRFTEQMTSQVIKPHKMW